MASRVSSPEDAGCFCFNLDSGLTGALPKVRTKRVLCPLLYRTHTEKSILEINKRSGLITHYFER